MPVDSVNSVSAVNYLKDLSNSDTKKNNTVEKSFMDYMKEEIEKANQLSLDAKKKQEEFAAGKADNIHDVLIAAEKADVAVQYVMQIRNKVLDAYNEIMRMQV